MTQTEASDAQNHLRTDFFRPDWRHSARHMLCAILIFLALFVFLIFESYTGNPPNQESLLGLAGIFAVVAFASDSLIRKIHRKTPVLAVGPDGVAFPHVGVPTIDWKDVERAELVRTSGRGTAVLAVRFHFRSGRLKRRQVGSLRKDRWEVILSMKAAFFGWESLRIVGGSDAVLTSIERYRHIKR